MWLKNVPKLQITHSIVLEKKLLIFLYGVLLDPKCQTFIMTFCLGLAERTMEIMMKRGAERQTFGKRIIEHVS